MDASETVKLAEEPCGTVALAGETATEKSGTTTTRLAVAECVLPDAVAVRVIGYVPGTAEVVTASVSVVEDPRESDVLRSVPVVPAGAPLTERVAVPVEPPTPGAVTVNAPD